MSTGTSEFTSEAPNCFGNDARDQPLPLDRQDLVNVLAHDLSLARTLPAAAYLSDEVFDWEQRHYFDGGWVAVARSETVATPGDHTAIRFGRRGILLSRDRDGTLHAFLNACPHRGHELVAENTTSNKSGIRCPYHSWVFGLDGRLLNATHFADTDGFDKGEWPLSRVRSAEWAGWIFLNVSGTAPGFAEFLGDLNEILAPWLATKLVHGTTRSYVAETNWKLVAENYLECYHCPSIHPELCRVAGPDDFVGYDDRPRFWVGGAMALRDDADTMSLTGRGNGHFVPGLTPDELRQVHYIALPANLLVSAHPDYVMFHRLTPQSATSVRIECSFYFPAAAVDQPDFDPSFAADFWDVTNVQDFAACESVTRGMASGGFRPGVFDVREDGVRSFQGQVATLYLTQRWQHVIPSQLSAGLSPATHSGDQRS